MSERKTSQKNAITEVFEKAQYPMTIPQILAAARKTVPSLSQATVYRILKNLVEKNIIKPIKLPGEPPAYELADGRHHHFFRCRNCNHMYEVTGCDKLIDKLVPQNFKLESHEVYLVGLCDTCR